LIFLDPRQLKSKKKLSEPDVDKLKRQLQEVNTIIANSADFLHDDLATDTTGKHTCKFVPYLHYAIYNMYENTEDFYTHIISRCRLI